MIACLELGNTDLDQSVFFFFIFVIPLAQFRIDFGTLRFGVSFFSFFLVFFFLVEETCEVQVGLVVIQVLEEVVASFIGIAVVEEVREQAS